MLASRADTGLALHYERSEGGKVRQVENIENRKEEIEARGEDEAGRSDGMTQGWHGLGTDRHAVSPYKRPDPTP